VLSEKSWKVWKIAEKKKAERNKLNRKSEKDGKVKFSSSYRHTTSGIDSAKTRSRRWRSLTYIHNIMIIYTNP
jgi:hypothetical protein